MVLALCDADAKPVASFLKCTAAFYANGLHHVIAAHMTDDGAKGRRSTCRYVAGSSAARKNATSSSCRPIVIWMLFATYVPWQAHDSSRSNWILLAGASRSTLMHAQAFVRS